MSIGPSAPKTSKAVGGRLFQRLVSSVSDDFRQETSNAIAFLLGLFRGSLGCREPFEPSRHEAELLFGVCVGGAAQSRRVIDHVCSFGLKRLLFADVRRRGRSQEPRKSRKPTAISEGSSSTTL